MTPEQKIIDEVYEKYGEWLEMAKANESLMVIDRLIHMLLKARDLAEYYKRRLDYVSANTANR